MILPMDERIKSKIHHLVQQGVYSLAEMRRHLEDFVATTIPEMSSNTLNTRFHPKDQSIKNHIQLALARTLYVMLN